MIPKVIHFVWLGRGKYTPSVNRCLSSWRKVMPDYEIKCWNEDVFDTDSVPWVKEAIEMKKWSLASDYIRLYALYTEGGIYMDTDVMVYRRFDDFLQHSFFSSVEYHPDIFNKMGKQEVNENGLPLKEDSTIEGMGILAALCASEKGNPFIKECLDFFGSRHFIDENGNLFVDVINPAIMAMIAVKYGFIYRDKNQKLDGNMVIYSSSIFAGDYRTRTKDSYSMHFCDQSWVELSFKGKIKRWLKSNFPGLFRQLKSRFD